MILAGSDHFTIFLQLTLALVLGALLGFERLIAGKDAGMRTFAIVSVGSCLFVIIGELVAEQYLGVFNIDPLRTASSIITGIGFLGAGLIIFQHELKGLTTAAVLWVASGVGIAVGFKMYMIGAFTAFLTLFILIGVWYVEQFVERISREEKDT